MSTDMYAVLTALREIRDLADFDPEGAMSGDLGDLLVDIQHIAEHQLLSAGWSIEPIEVEDETNDEED